MNGGKTYGIGTALLLLAMTATILSGCAGRTPALDVRLPYASPEAALKRALPPLFKGALTTTARMELTDAESRYPLKAALMIKAPASLRLETIPLIGLPDLFVSLNEGEIRLFAPSKKCFCIGPATPRNIAKYLYLDIEASSLVSILLGRPPDDALLGGSMTGTMEEGLYRIDRRKNDVAFSLWIDPERDRVVRIRVRKNGIASYDAIFEKHTSVDGYILPQQIAIDVRETKKLTLKYTNPQIVPDVGESFTLPCPDGLEPSFLGEPTARHHGTTNIRSASGSSSR